MSDNRFIRMLALVAVLATASLWPAGVYAGYGGHNSGHASTPSGNGGTSGTSGTNRNTTPTVDRGSGKPVGGHSMGYVRCFRACMAVPNPGGMARFCSAACSR